MATSPLVKELLDLYDQMLELTDHCAFLCEAYSAMAIHNEAFDQHTTAGIVLAGQHLRDKAEAIQVQLKEMRENVRN